MTVTDALRIMGLTEDFSEVDLKARYRLLSRKFHPDLGGDARKMMLLTEARDLLSKNLGKIRGTSSLGVTHVSPLEVVKAV